jgi:hypothetical protein
MQIHPQFLSLAAVLAFACGSSTPNGSTPGTGTATLHVSATVSVENRTDNAADVNGFDTKFEVSVRRGGQVVGDAQVVVKSSSGARALSLDGDKYKGGHVGYDRVYELEVVAGADNVRGAAIAGPTLHRITSPLPGATIQPRQDLTIRWSRDAAADSAHVETKRFKIESTQDVGSFVVLGSNIPGKNGQTDEDQVTIIRSTRVGLAGGTAGSEITAKVRNRIERLVVAPLP